MRTWMLAAAVLAVFSCPALAQNNWPTPGGSTAAGSVQMCVTGGVATPCGASSPAYTVFAAGEFHVGEFGNNQTIIYNAMTIATAQAYVAGNAVGTLQTLAGAVRVTGSAGNSGTSGNVLSTVLVFGDATTLVGGFDVYYFNATPNSACTDHTAFALTGSDRDKVVGIAHLTDLTSLGAPVIQAIGPPIPYTINGATTMYACIVSKAAFTSGATGALGFKVGALRQ